jgi:hypothetical protein
LTKHLKGHMKAMEEVVVKVVKEAEEVVVDLEDH